jgi:hypothetical protein
MVTALGALDEVIPGSEEHPPLIGIRLFDTLGVIVNAGGNSG